MKITNWSAVAVITLTAVSATHCNIASALTYEETACVAQAFNEGWDPTRCFATGTGGGAGSGGSGGTGGDASGDDGSGFGGLGYTRKNCPTPTFWFTGPPDPSTASSSTIDSKAGNNDVAETTTKFVLSSGGQLKQYSRLVREVVGPSDTHVGPELKSLFYYWSVTPVDASGAATGSSQIKDCEEIPY